MIHLRKVGARALTHRVLLPLYFIFMTTSIFVYVFCNSGTLYQDLVVRNGKVDEEFTIKTQGCTIPALNPFDSAIIKYVKYPKHVENACGKSMSLLKHNKTHIWISSDVLFDGDRERNNISCCYQKFYRPNFVEDVNSPLVDERIAYDGCKNFTNYIQVNKYDEFVRVTCSNNDTEVYKQFYAFAPEKEYHSHDGSKEIPANKTAYNVIVLGIDAVSRLNFHRTMPKTVSWLKEKGAVDLKGYNKVADNTYPNIIPMLLGVTLAELKKICVTHQKSTFDNCPFIWEWFKQTGYFTALAEDSSWLGLFNYVKAGGPYGFISTPVDYYLHPFISAADAEVGRNKDFTGHLCMQDEFFYKVLLNYIEDLTSTLRFKKLFGFFWEITMTHDYLNSPMLMDDSYVEALKRMDEKGYLEQTVLLMVSDHGMRWGDIRPTTQGRLEESLPFVFMLTPKKFRDDYTAAYNNLKINSQRLTTPFDIHKTLSDLVDLDSIDNRQIISRLKEQYSSDRGISLFLPIPGNRTCKLAGIDDHWCTCLTGHKIDLQSDDALEASSRLIKELNNLLKRHQDCAKLSIDIVLDVTRMKGDDEEDEFLVVIRTEPGAAVFEATLRRRDARWRLSGTISRLNVYGDQSRCVDDKELKLYCYCIDHISER